MNDNDLTAIQEQLNRIVEPIRRAFESLAQLPAITIRCAVCRRRAVRYDPTLPKRRVRGDWACKVHGELEDLSIEEWATRGRKARNIYLRPLS